jgi:magnesium-transporting ATPase (P-type)
VTRDPYLGRDALNVIEGEMRQFESKFDVIKRFVE